jgi:hypothetical protein
MIRLSWLDGLVAFGGLLTALAVLWWWIVFEKVVISQTLSITDVVPCLAAHTDMCTLAQSLCLENHFLGIETYFAESFWISATILASALVLRFIPRDQEA